MASREGIYLMRIVMCIALLIHDAQAASLVKVKNVTIIGTQTDSQFAVSRDGGVSTVLNGNILWLFDDTTVTDSSGELVSFSSNTAALALNPSNVTALQDIVHPPAGVSGIQPLLQTDAGTQTGGWIPLSSSEVTFNRSQTSESRLAIWPGTNPLAVSPAVAWLWAPVVQVNNVTDGNLRKTHQNYTYQYTTVSKIEDTNSGIFVTRFIDSLFAANNDTGLSGHFAPFGCFANLVGKSSECYDGHSTACRQRSVYLMGAWGDNLQLARLALQDIGKSEDAYEFWQSDSCSFSSPGDTSKLSISSESYLQHSFSSGSVFYSPFFETFLLVYMNADADSTLYLRYLDLNILSCASNSTLWQKGGIDGEGITMEDAEAIIHYQWSESQVLFMTPMPADSTLKYNYAGMAHAEYFNRQYYQQWMYSNGGIDSGMRSPWLGHEVVTEADAGGDGKHLMLSWTTSDKNGYEVVMAKVEFDRAPESSAESPRSTHYWNAVLGAALVLLLL